jgi:DNA-directed RNA polymerase specialized sigma24 family protein
LITYLFHKIFGWDATALHANLADDPVPNLESLVHRLAEACGQDRRLPGGLVSSCFASLMAKLEKTLDDAVTNEKARASYEDLLDRQGAKTTIRDHFKPNTPATKSIALWCKNVGEAIREEPELTQAPAINPQVVEQLYAEYAEEIKAYIRRPGVFGEDLRKIVEGTRARVLTQIESYDPAKKTFREFLRACATAAQRDYYGQPEPRPRKEVGVRPIGEETPDEARERLEHEATEKGRQFVTDRPDPPDAERGIPREAKHRRLFLEAAFNGGLPPHKPTVVLIPMVHRNTEGSQEGAREVELPPYWQEKEIVAELSDVKLRRLGSEFVEKYIQQVDDDDLREVLRPRFKPYLESMDRPVERILAHHKTRKVYKGPRGADVRAGETLLQHYYGQDPVQSIYLWQAEVKKKAWAWIVENHRDAIFDNEDG